MNGNVSIPTIRTCVPRCAGSGSISMSSQIRRCRPATTATSGAYTRRPALVRTANSPSRETAARIESVTLGNVGSGGRVRRVVRLFLYGISAILLLFDFRIAGLMHHGPVVLVPDGDGYSVQHLLGMNTTDVIMLGVLILIHGAVAFGFIRTRKSATQFCTAMADFYACER